MKNIVLSLTMLMKIQDVQSIPEKGGPIESARMRVAQREVERVSV